MTHQASPVTTSSSSCGLATNAHCRRHLLIGWGGLLVFTVLGVALEGMHAFKSPLYLDVDNETRRMMWRLAHGHGALIALLHVAYAATCSMRGLGARTRPPLLASSCLSGALLLIPVGFFWGGVSAQNGDPGDGIALVPAGAFLMIVSMGMILLRVYRSVNEES